MNNPTNSRIGIVHLSNNEEGNSRDNKTSICVQGNNLGIRVGNSQTMFELMAGKKRETEPGSFCVAPALRGTMIGNEERKVPVLPLF